MIPTEESMINSTTTLSSDASQIIDTRVAGLLYLLGYALAHPEQRGQWIGPITLLLQRLEVTRG
jgi:hypothetical protein